MQKYKAPQFKFIEMSDETTRCCTNHTCQKAVDTLHDNHVICSLCRDALYCSEECRMVDWPAHACPNAVRAPAIGTVLAVPYYFEDLMPSALLESELADPTSPLNQSFLLTHVGTDMRVTQWQQSIGDNVSYDKMGGLGRGAEPPSKYLAAAFNVKIWDSYDSSKQPKVELSGIVGERAIHSQSEDALIRQVAIGPKDSFFRRLTYGKEKQSTSIILWPLMERTGVEFRSQGQILAHVQIGGADPMPISFAYKDLHKMFALKGSLLKYFQTRLRLKFPSRDAGIKNMHTIRATNTSNGVEIFLTFLVEPKMTDIELVDVEVAVPIRKLPKEPVIPENKDNRLSAQQRKSLEDLGIQKEEYVTAEKQISSIYCDTSKVEHMTGLTMALEYAATQIKAEMLQAPSNMPAFEEAAAIVRKHTRDMIEGKVVDTEDGAPMHVNAAVYTAVNALQEMQTIDLPFGSGNVNKYLGKLSDAADSKGGEAAAVQVAFNAVDALEKKMQKTRGSKFLSGIRKGVIRKDLEDWRSAIRKFSGKIQERITGMQSIMQTISDALSSA